MKKTKKEKRAEKLQKQSLNGDAVKLSQPVESVPKPVEKPSELKHNSTSDLNTSKKKKNKKEKVKEVESEEMKSTKKIKVKITDIEQPEKSKKKKKKEKNKAKAENVLPAENSSLSTGSSPAIPDTASEGDLNSMEQDSSLSDKKKKKKKEKKKDKLDATESAEPAKESTETAANGEESTKKKRKKEKGIKGKLFDESADWDSEGKKKTFGSYFYFLGVMIDCFFLMLYFRL